MAAGVRSGSFWSIGMGGSGRDKAPGGIGHMVSSRPSLESCKMWAPVITTLIYQCLTFQMMHMY